MNGGQDGTSCEVQLFCMSNALFISESPSRIKGHGQSYIATRAT